MDKLLLTIAALAMLAPATLATEPSVRLEGTLDLLPELSYQTPGGERPASLPKRPLTFTPGCDGAGPCEEVMMRGRVPTLRSQTIQLERRECFPGVGGTSHDGEVCYVGMETTKYTGRCTVKKRKRVRTDDGYRWRTYRKKVTRRGRGTRLVEIANGDTDPDDPADEDWSGNSRLYMYFMAPIRSSGPPPGWTPPGYLQPERSEPLPGHPAPKWLTDRACDVSPKLLYPYRRYKGRPITGLDARLKRPAG